MSQLSEGLAGDLFQTGHDRFELAILFDGRVNEGRGFGGEPHVNSLAPRLVGPFIVRTVAFGGVSATGTLGFAASHHSSQYGAFREIVDRGEFRFQLLKACCISVWGN